jgi:hypothetical protein
VPAVKGITQCTQWRRRRCGERATFATIGGTASPCRIRVQSRVKKSAKRLVEVLKIHAPARAGMRLNRLPWDATDCYGLERVAIRTKH